jgi:hypothetical protein
VLLLTFDPITNQEKKIKNRKRKFKIQEDIHEEILEDYPIWW